MAVKMREPIRKVWQTLSSVKTGVILLIIVVIVSAGGTLILQRPITEPEEMQRAYPPQVLRILDAVKLTDVYHAWWFVLLLALVSLSIVAASIERFPNSWRYFSRPYKSPNESFRKTLATRKQIPIEDEETAVLAAARALRELGFKPELVTSDKHVSLFAERNRISEMAVYIVHASLLLIFLGGIVDALYGWRGFVALTPGQQSSQIALRNGATRTLPFAIRCDSAGQENYSDGSPKRWWSRLTVVQNGSEIQRKEIVVNDPLVFQGVRFYQSSYGPTGKLDKLLLSATPASGQEPAKEVSLALDQSVALDADTSVRLAEFIPDYVVRDNQIYTRSASVENPAAHLVVASKKSGQSVNVWLPAIPGFAENDKSPYRFEAQDLKMGYFTGLEVSHEPGQWAVWTGVILMGLGLALVFYLVHVRFWVVPVLDARGRLALWIGGTANKNREVFEEKFAKLVEAIEKQVKSESAACVPQHATSVAG
jgi:cytochrome c biogenesis protein